MQHVLMIDDDDDDRFLFDQALRTMNLPVSYSQCSSAEEGLAYLRNGKLPDWIFLDINMPRMSGFECLRQIKSRPPFSDIPIVIYSTSGQDADIERARALGASFYLVKPASFHCLCSVLMGIFNEPAIVSDSHMYRL